MEGGFSVATITAAIGNIFTIMGDVLDQIVSNPLFLMFFVIGLIYSVINVIKALKHA